MFGGALFHFMLNMHQKAVWQCMAATPFWLHLEHEIEHSWTNCDKGNWPLWTYLFSCCRTYC